MKYTWSCDMRTGNWGHGKPQAVPTVSSYTVVTLLAYLWYVITYSSLQFINQEMRFCWVLLMILLNCNCTIQYSLRWIYCLKSLKVFGYLQNAKSEFEVAKSLPRTVFLLAKINLWHVVLINICRVDREKSVSAILRSSIFTSISHVNTFSSNFRDISPLHLSLWM